MSCQKPQRFFSFPFPDLGIELSNAIPTYALKSLAIKTKYYFSE